jgi:SOS response regulatory protein OraA/RecX
VALEVDGQPWRTVPDEVVATCGLAAGVDLDRPLLRRLRGELRRAEALDAAARALARRPLSHERLRERLRRQGVRPPAEREAVATLDRLGLVDDARLAAERARALARRGWGDAAIVARLEAEGLAQELVARALAELEPEQDRAARLAETSGDPRTTWKLLARRGFSLEAIEAALGALDEGVPGGLG